MALPCKPACNLNVGSRIQDIPQLVCWSFSPQQKGRLICCFWSSSSSASENRGKRIRTVGFPNLLREYKCEKIVTDLFDLVTWTQHQALRDHTLAIHLKKKHTHTQATTSEAKGIDFDEKIFCKIPSELSKSRNQRSHMCTQANIEANLFAGVRFWCFPVHKDNYIINW